MASKSYFKNFPIIEYNAKIARNIIARPRLKESILSNPLAFYDYVIEHDMRPDQVAAGYYKDPSLLWLIFLANDIVDPYYEWPLTQEQFRRHLIAKYGSVEEAQSKILHYKHKTNGTIISTDTYTLNGTFGKIQASQYTQVYAYTFEDEANDAKRQIKLVDYRLASQAAKQLKSAMNT